MIELRRIFRAFQAAEAATSPLLLATVVRVEGSTYRRPGARLLLSEERWLAGGVSGGCVEGDLLKRAFHRTERGPALVAYDSRTDDEDAGWGRALGCNGLVEVWLERLRPDDPVHPVRTLASWAARRTPGALATILSGPHDVGARCAVAPGGASATTVRDPALGARAEAAARAALASRRSGVVELPATGGAAAAFVEYVPAPQRLLVFGHGHDVPPVVAFARALGWDTAVVASRRTAATDGLAAPDELVVCHPAAVGEHVAIGPNDAAIVMTHDLEHDRLLLAHLLASPPAYVGVLGPKRRTERLLADVAARAGAIPAAALERVHGPAGLDIGAEGPDEIALAVVAEIRAVLAGRAGGSLRRSDAPIHGRET